MKSAKELFDFTGKVAVVTGASSGLGRDAARAYAQSGADVAVLACRAERLEDLAREIKENTGRDCIAVTCDVTFEESVRDSVQTVLDHYGKIDILMNNAGTNALAGAYAKYGITANAVGPGLFPTEMDTDLAVIFGREGLAEPKKLGVTATELKDGRFVGTVSRFGQELLRVEADVVGPATEPIVADALDNFHFKYTINADGSGISDAGILKNGLVMDDMEGIWLA